MWWGWPKGWARLSTVTVYEGSRVQRIVRRGAVSEVITAQAKVSAPLVFLALNALAPQQVPDRERSLRAERGQVFVTEPLATQPCIGGFGTAMAWWRKFPKAMDAIACSLAADANGTNPIVSFRNLRRTASPASAARDGGLQPLGCPPTAAGY